MFGVQRIQTRGCRASGASRHCKFDVLARKGSCYSSTWTSGFVSKPLSFLLTQNVNQVLCSSCRFPRFWTLSLLLSSCFPFIFFPNKPAAFCTSRRSIQDISLWRWVITQPPWAPSPQRRSLRCGSRLFTGLYPHRNQWSTHKARHVQTYKGFGHKV